VDAPWPPAWLCWGHCLKRLEAESGWHAETGEPLPLFDKTAADGTPSVETGRLYRQAILKPGGNHQALESSITFRGREPSPEALLRRQGMAAG
jgi:hypothetical protein